MWGSSFRFGSLWAAAAPDHEVRSGGRLGNEHPETLRDTDWGTEVFIVTEFSLALRGGRSRVTAEAGWVLLIGIINNGAKRAAVVSWRNLLLW